MARAFRSWFCSKAYTIDTTNGRIVVSGEVRHAGSEAAGCRYSYFANKQFTTGEQRLVKCAREIQFYVQTTHNVWKRSGLMKFSSRNAFRGSISRTTVGHDAPRDAHVGRKQHTTVRTTVATWLDVADVMLVFWRHIKNKRSISSRIRSSIYREREGETLSPMCLNPDRIRILSREK
jgi:hypothetical protein